MHLAELGSNWSNLEDDNRVAQLRRPYMRYTFHITKSMDLPTRGTLLILRTRFHYLRSLFANNGCLFPDGPPVSLYLIPPTPLICAIELPALLFTL